MHNQHPHAFRAGDLRQTSKGMRPGRDSGESGDRPTHSEPTNHYYGRAPVTLQSGINDGTDFTCCSWVTSIALDVKGLSRASDAARVPRDECLSIASPSALRFHPIAARRRIRVNLPAARNPASARSGSIFATTVRAEFPLSSTTENRFTSASCALLQASAGRSRAWVGVDRARSR